MFANAPAEEEKAAARKEKQERKAVEKEDTDNKRSFLSRLSVKRKSRETAAEETEGTTGAAAAAGGTALGEVAAVNNDHKADVPLSTPSTKGVATEPQEEHAAVTQPSSLPLAAVESPQAVEEPSSPLETGRDAIVKPDGAGTDEDTHTKSQKGIKGLFSKLRSRKPHSEEDASTSKPATSTSAVTGSTAVADKQHKDATVEPVPVVASSITAPAALPQPTGHHDQADAPVRVSGAESSEEPLSPSSFRRHDVDDDDADISSLSSGVDEDDFKEGRTGRAARALRTQKTTSATGTEKATKYQDKVAYDQDEEDEGEETFEEARDTVEANTASEHVVLGQTNATQQGRETKFQEVL